MKYTPRETAAVAAFNERMTRAHAPADFLLPDCPNASSGAAAEDDGIAWTKFLAVDDEGAVRGGFLLMEAPGWLNGATVPTANYQAPLSEGICDKRFGFVATHMLKYVQSHFPYCYAVGMGNPARPLPRLLKAAGWSVGETPFFFRVVQAGRACRELQPLQKSAAVRGLAAVAGRTGLAQFGAALVHARRHVARRDARGMTLEPVHEWGAWADDIWATVRGANAFALVRNAAVLRQLYPLSDGRCLAYLVRKGGAPVGWAACLNTRMRGHNWFGNLTVGTILDCAAAPHAATATIALAADALASNGADVIVSNHAHAQWGETFRRCGFLSGPSNYLFAASKPLAEAIARGGPGRVHLVRGDGDGRIHL